jgi:hypothetical protein
MTDCITTVKSNYTNTLTNNNRAAASGKQKTSLNLCAPSLNVRMKISLGLVNQNRPSRPNCAWSDMRKAWDVKGAYEDLTGAGLTKEEKNKNFYSALRNMFDVQSSDLSAALEINTSMMEVVGLSADKGRVQLLGKGGWIDPTNIGGKIKGLPDKAKTDAEIAKQGYISNMGTFTGDVFMDAAGIFLNQMAKTAFDRWMNKLEGGSSTGGGTNFVVDGNRSGSYDYLANQQALMETFAPNFKEQVDYDILGQLAVCTDQKNPAPNECVIDGKFMEAISSQKTVGQALQDGSLNKSGVLSADSKVFDYNEKYSLRNAMILRKFRIIPVGWEEAIRKAAQENKVATLGDMISCFSDSDQYATFKNPAIEGNQAWCRGLIDPNWVLKAPQTRCAKSGFGNQILSMIPFQTGTTSPASDLTISRADDYCADERTCINEVNGVCDAWGYCTADRRTWNFNGDSCEAVYNSCETFSDQKGNSISYLKNTLDYGSCDDSNSGCRQYSTFGSYTSTTNTISWSGNNAYSIFLNDKAATCDASSEGCRSLVRVKPTWGDNLVFNSDFSADPMGSTSTASGILNNHWQVNGGSVKVVTSDSVVSGSGSGKALSLTTTGSNVSLVSDGTFSVIPENSTVISGYYYTLSAEVYLGTSQSITLTLGAPDSVSKTFDGTGEWQSISLTARPSDEIGSLNFSVTGTNNFSLRKIKLEANNRGAGSAGFAWSNYGDSLVNDKPVVTNEKLIPDYLASLCYKNPFASGVKDYRLKDNAPDICNNFARLCNKDEVGCQTFSDRDGFSLTAKVNFDEYCPDVCVGYDSYVQRKTNFQDVSVNYFIPNSATKCSAASAGCSRFTNLDEVAQGGENNEYYSALRRCVQPDNSCGVFYSWSGEGENGYQLKSFNLVASSTGQTMSPKVFADDSSECNEAIFKLPVGDPDANPDCRQFYNKAGGVSYHLYSKTISCSSECRKLRLDETVTASECSNNGGSFASSTCIFKALPSQSASCSEAERGCREYNGNNGNNVNNVATYDFENPVNPFVGGATSTISTNKNGHSLKLDATTAATLTANMRMDVSYGSAYYLKFLAKASNQGANLSVYFENASGTQAVFNSGIDTNTSIEIDDVEWKVYQVSLPVLNHRVEAGEKFVLSSEDTIYLDSIVLTEVTDRYYLIKDSWLTDDVCYYDLNDEYRGAEYNLGCSAYQDPLGVSHNLRQFSSLCDESSAGCEAMIDTRNSKSPFVQSFASSTVNVLGDRMIYAIFNPEKECSVDNLGCSRLGEGKKVGTNLFFSDVFLKNNPDNYEGVSGTLCEASAVGCETFFDSKAGKSFFRNPDGNACRYRAGSGSTSQSMSWFKEPVKRCGPNGVVSGTEALCASDSDCLSGSTCVLDTTDHPCDVSYSKTIGNTGAGAPQPSQDAGVCEIAASGCSEYIDSTSAVSPNLVLNPTFDDLDNNGTIGDNWATSTITGYSQDIYLNAHKLYLARSVRPDQSGPQSGAERIVCDNFASSSVINILQADNQISSTATSTIKLPDGIGVYFIPKYNSICHVYSTPTGGVFKPAKLIEVREAVVEYQKEGNVDLKSCNSKVDFDNGCVLFNNRANNGSKGQISPLSYNAFASLNSVTSPVACSANSINCNANVVVKVTPNRVCSRWLACTTAVKDDKTGMETCYALNECDKLTEGGGCGNFVGSATSTHVFNYAQDKNATGYSLLNAYNIANMKEVGEKIDFAINFENNLTPFDFKTWFANNAPTSTSSVTAPDYTNPSAPAGDYVLIDEPTPIVAGKKSGVSYPAEGKAFVGIDSANGKMLGKKGVNLTPNKEYYLSYLVNTDNLSGLQSMVKVLDDSNISNVLQSFKDTSRGWQRIVHRIKVSKPVVAITFGTTKTATGNGSGVVYYDDIKIEPVLKINDFQNTNDQGNYLAKECRMYPTEDSASLTCTSRDSNVVKNGWEGYCLQHDPLNPGVCLQWLPLENIVSSNLNIKSTSYAGRGGVYPLYYCAEANAQFDLVEKREFSRRYWQDFWYTGSGSATQLSPGVENYSDGVYCYFDTQESISLGKNLCDYNHFFLGYDSGRPFNGAFFNVNTSGSNYGYYPMDINKNFVRQYCEPNKPTDLPLSYFAAVVWGWHGYDVMCIPLPLNGKLVDITVIPVTLTTAGGDSFGNGANFGTNGWYPYDGNLVVRDPHLWGSDTSSNPGCQAPGCKYPYSETSIRVFDHNQSPVPTTEAGLKYPNRVGSITDEEIFTPHCNKFVQVVDQDGKGQPWMDRIFNPDYATSTSPSFFPVIKEFGYNASSSFSLFAKKFGQTVISATAPYGAASFLNSLSNTAVKFGTNYYNNNNSGTEKSPLAGRPYSCFDKTVDGDSLGSCKYLGYCEKAPAVNCLTVSGDGTNASCSADGPCISYNYASENTDFKNAPQKNILKNIFLSTKNAWLWGALGYNLDDRYSYDAYFSTSTDKYKDVYQIKLCNNSSRPADNDNFGLSPSSDSDFCAILPEIKNVSLSRGNGSSAVLPAVAPGEWLVTPGYYTLKFNTIVDKNQQPLGDIEINWGDGQIDLINTQDNHPNLESPHAISHNYSYSAGAQATSRKIKIKITDNWGFYRAFP